MIKKIRVRIAPSPTGDPHVGTAYIALFNFVFAKQNKGKFILRIEDTDRARLVPGSEKMIFESLKWLGLAYDEGPDVGGPFGPYRQSERLEIYKKYAEELVRSGHAYYCYCTPERLAQLREEQAKKHLPPMYDGRCKKIKNQKLKIKNNEKYVIRLDVPDGGETVVHDLVRGDVVFKNELIDDQVLLKSDGYPTYHLANVVDDHLMKISHVIRAEEWLSSTPKHLLLYEAFGWEPPKFAHTPLLRKSDRSKISKRKDPVSLIWYKEQGYLPEAILNFLALLGWSMPNGEDVFTIEDMVKHFSFERVVKSGPVFNLAKLDWFNGQYIRRKSTLELFELLRPYFQEKTDEKKVKEIIPLVHDRLTKLSDWNELTDFFFVTPSTYEEKILLQGHEREKVKEVIEKGIDLFNSLPEPWKHEEWEKRIRQLADEKGWKHADVFQIFRVAISGKTATPPLFETMGVLGKEEVVKRMKVTDTQLK